MTLIELLIVMVVIGILAAIAYPSYRDYSVRAKRNEARSALLQIATNQERFYLNNNQFTADMTNLGFPVATNYLTDTGSYQVSVTVPPGGQTYTATATYQNSDDENSRCGAFTIQETGAKGSSPYADCWTRTR